MELRSELPIVLRLMQAPERDRVHVACSSVEEGMPAHEWTKGEFMLRVFIFYAVVTIACRQLFQRGHGTTTTAAAAAMGSVRHNVIDPP